MVSDSLQAGSPSNHVIIALTSDKVRNRSQLFLVPSSTLVKLTLAEIVIWPSKYNVKIVCKRSANLPRKFIRYLEYVFDY